MATPLTQDGRLIKLYTPLGKDKLLVQSFSGEESISRLFRFQLDLVSEEETIAPKDIVGKNVTLGVMHADESTERFFNAHVSRFSQLPSQGRYYRYQAELVAWPWFLTLSADCKIYQEMSILDIIEEVFGRFGFTDYRFDTQGQHNAREYCVQYRETAFDFITRLLEEEGVFYYFEHEKGKHTLVMADHKGTHQPCPFQSKIDMETASGPGFSRDEDSITHWERHYEFRTGKWAQTDYNFETPSTKLLSTVDTIVKLDKNKSYEIYDYPGEYLKKAEGDSLTKLRMEEEEVGYDVASGNSDCRALVSGYKFTLQRHPQRDQNKTYVLTSVVHSGQQAGFSGEGAATEANYANSFRCIPDTVTFRPARVTPRPFVRGTQTAVVVGPGGEEIYTEKHGRVKVQFHWDRDGQKDDKSSCWIRVSQPWAGKNWGAIWLPRIGQEVVVDFLEGDPDRPIIIGRVYNAEQPPPYSLPGDQTQSGFKSRSSKNGGADDYNEIRFEDKKGSELITVHAQKNLDTTVENNETRLVENNRTTTIVNNETKTIKQGNQELTIKMGNNTVAIKMGNMSTKLDLGKEEREAMQSIELKVGQSSVKLDQMGVTIKGMMIKIEGQIMVDVKGLMTTVKGDAMLTLQGGIVMIN
jgi:type VI secretion system secreted protein VgrG